MLLHNAILTNNNEEEAISLLEYFSSNIRCDEYISNICKFFTIFEWKHIINKAKNNLNWEHVFNNIKISGNDDNDNNGNKYNTFLNIIVKSS